MGVLKTLLEVVLMARKRVSNKCKRGAHDYKKINQYMKECEDCGKKLRIGFAYRKNRQI